MVVFVEPCATVGEYQESEEDDNADAEYFRDCATHERYRNCTDTVHYAIPEARNGARSYRDWFAT